MTIDKIRAYVFIAYEMYIKGLTKEEVDSLSAFNLVMEMDDYNKWVKAQNLEL